MQINKTYLVIEFKDDELTAIEFTYNWKKLVLKNYSFLKLEEGIIRGGRIIKEEELIKAIQNLFATAVPNQLRSNNLIAIISDDVNFHHVLQVPKQLNDKELLNVIPAKAENHIPYPKDELYWDYRLGSEDSTDNTLVQYSASPKDVIKSYVDVFEKLGLNIQIITGIAESYIDVIRDLADEDKNILVLELNYNATNLLLYKQGLLHATKRIELGVSKCLEGLAELQGISVGELIDFLTEEETKLTVDTTGMTCFDPLFEEIRKNISSLINHKELDKIFVWGLGLRLPNMLENLQQNLKPSPEINLMWRSISISKNLRRTNILDHINKNVLNFGVAVSGAYNFINPYGNKILNFLPEQNKRSVGNNVMHSFMNRLGLFILTFSLGTIFLLTYTLGNFIYEEQKLTQQTRIFESDIYGDRYYELKDNISTFNQEVAYLYNLSIGLEDTPEILTDILNLDLENIQIENLDYKKEDGLIDIRGIAKERSDLVLLKERLNSMLKDGTVSAPISNFDASRDIAFNFQILFNPSQDEQSN
jgi:type IV pilus assembly protein PilM